MVVEYASNGSLRERLCQYASQPFPLGATLLVLSQIAQALQYAHSQNIVHRDIKPANILFNSKGEAILDQEAIEAYEEAIRLDPNDASAHHNKGYALDELRRYEEAIEAHEMVGDLARLKQLWQ